MRRFLLALGFAAALSSPAAAQYPAGPTNQSSLALIAPTPASPTENSKRIATTEWVNNLITSGLQLASGKIWIGSAGNIATPQTPSGDCTFALSGVITCTQAAGSFQVIGNLSVGGSIIDGNGILATNIAAPATPAAGTTRIYVDSTTKTLSAKNDAGTVGNTVVASVAVANQFMTGISAAGVITRAQPAVTDLSGLGTGVATALAVAVGSAGAPVVNGGALGTPSTGVGTNLTALNATNLGSGTVPAARFPAFTGDCATSAGAIAITCVNTTAWGAISSPTPTCTGGVLTSNSARFKTVGKTTFFQYDITVASGTCTSTTTNVSMNLPNTANSGGGFAAFENAGGATIICAILASATVINCRSSANLVTASHFNISGVYENQ